MRTGGRRESKSRKSPVLEKLGTLTSSLSSNEVFAFDWPMGRQEI